VADVSRYVVTELEGYAITLPIRAMGHLSVPGLSVQVVDTALCHRVVAAWRTEDYGGGWPQWRKRGHIRRLAAERAEALNAAL
jgi:hypothetical protein